MIIESDITNSFSFTAKNNRGLFKQFTFNENSDGGSPLFTLELKQFNQESEVKIQKHEKNHAGNWLYRTKFDGTINSPKDLISLFQWLKII